MILLDTDHLSLLRYASNRRGQLLQSRLEAATDPVIATTIVSYEEQMRGWMAEASRERDFPKQVRTYERLEELITFFRDWTTVAFDGRSAEECNRLRRWRIRIGTMDLKIASIALVHDALLLSANLRDFQRVPGLKVENWLD